MNPKNHKNEEVVMYFGGKILGTVESITYKVEKDQKSGVFSSFLGKEGVSGTMTGCSLQINTEEQIQAGGIEHV